MHYREQHRHPTSTCSSDGPPGGSPPTCSWSPDLPSSADRERYPECLGCHHRTRIAAAILELALWIGTPPAMPGRALPAPRGTIYEALCCAAFSVLRYAEFRNVDFRVVGEAKAIDAIGGLELSFRDQLSLVVAGNDSSVDPALHAAALYGKGDLLSHGLSHASSLVYRGVGVSL